tara:strand:+ start:108 stop:329 length:222 start_codon:yes stop_codon:yes gene_type:complete
MYGRIPDEKQLFKVGDLLSYKGEQVTVRRVDQQSVYYEHRPVASYRAYLYAVIKSDGTKLYLQAEDLSHIEQL